MAHFDILYLCTDNNAKSRSGLEALSEAGLTVMVLAYEIPAVRLDPKRPREIYTRPRWYRKRWLKKQSSTIYCHENGIPYFVVHELDFEKLLPAIRPIRFEHVIVNGWPARLPVEIAALSKNGAMNCHSSYLPEYRGGNITYAPLINKEKTSGITVHVVTEKLDSGPIIAQKRFDIDEGESTKSLAFKRSLYIGEVLISALDNIERGVSLKENPPSVFWVRQSYLSYILYRIVNALRSVLRLRPLRRQATATRLIDRV